MKEPKTALLTYSEYYILNEKLSTLRGWEIGKDTERVYPMLPQLAKVNVTYNSEGVETGYENLCVMEISSEFQELYPELMPTLHDSYIPSPDAITEIIAEGMTTEQIDWAIKHFRLYHDGLKTIWLESEAPSLELEPIMEELGSKLTLIVVDNEI
jgi:hypothetical protein